MADEPLAQQLVTLRKLLDDVDERLGRAPMAPAGLEDLKSSVDTLRTNMWAILSAGHGATAPVRVERLKLRRAIQGIKAVRGGLSAPGGGTLHPEHIELQLVARELADQIGKLR
jgi:glycine/D-amino acid oxidase-like deaminating enzyme